MVEVILSLIPIGFLGYMVYRVFRSKRKTTPESTRKIVEPADKVILHGHDLSKWNYLGYCRCTYVDQNGNLTGEYPIFLFADKNNDKRRSYYISGDSSGHVERNHNFVNKYVKTWAAGEGEVYYRVQGEHSCPSDYLKSYMLDKFGAEWDDSTNWWGTNDKAKYTSAKNKQKREQKPAETKTESNVVTVDFGKQA